MIEKPAILVLVCLIGTAMLGAEIARQPLLREGFVLRGVDGKLIGPDSNDVWFFEFSSDVNDYRVVVKAGTRLELLPSSALEKMAADVKIRSASTYRLWNARITKYRGRNFIFPNFFLPLSKIKTLQSQTQQGPQQERRRQAVVDEPNDVLAIPKEIMERLKTRRVKTADINGIPIEEQPLKTETGGLLNAKRYTQSADSVLVDRTALLVRQDDDRLVFVLDALGRKLQNVSLKILPSEALELTELKESTEPEPVRFKIAGIMTKYNGQNYLLLQKATQAYSHGNFGR